MQHFSFDFEADEQEEKAHQSIVGPMSKANRADLEIEKVKIPVGERRVRGDYLEDCGNHQNDAADRLVLKELAKGRSNLMN
ncbi:hypothetical protein ABIA14_006608 [Sinorhizobium fredii]